MVNDRCGFWVGWVLVDDDVAVGVGSVKVFWVYFLYDYYVSYM